MDSGSHSGSTLYTETLAVLKMIPAPGSRKNYKLMCWWDNCRMIDLSLFVYISQIRYNFRARNGEVKIVREYRQRCPKHGGQLVFPRLGEEGGANFVMMKTKMYIQKRFYGGPSFLSLTNTRSRNSTGSSSVSSAGDSTYTSSNPNSSSVSPQQGDSLAHLRANTNTSRRQKKKLPLYKPLLSHSRENCEACILSHCPFPKYERIIILSLH